MTRINLVPPSELADQHLFAEFREIQRLPGALSRSLFSKTTSDVLKKIPSHFTLNTGHVTFFYDKGLFLRKRYESLIGELNKRGVHKFEANEWDSKGIMSGNLWYNDYTPTEKALVISRERLAEKIAMKPSWYRWSKSGGLT